MAHAFLFEGPAGVGKRTAALAFAQAVNCPQPVGGDACGECATCRRIERGIDVDVRVFAPSRLGYRKPEAVEIRGEASITPNTGRKKFLILDSADRIEPVAANLLLKIIEEPPEFTVFILLTENLHRILPTIRSRTLVVSFRPLALNEVLAVAGDRIPAERAQYLYTVAKGDLGTMLRLSEDRKLGELFEDIEAELKERVLKVVPASPIRLAEEIADLAGRIDLSEGDETPASALRKSTVTVIEVMMSMIERKYITCDLAGRTDGTYSGKPGRHRTGSRLLESAIETVKSIEGGAGVPLALESMTIDFRKIVSEHSKEKAS